jgi:hypothetical protein
MTRQIANAKECWGRGFIILFLLISFVVRGHNHRSWPRRAGLSIKGNRIVSPGQEEAVESVRRF